MKSILLASASVLAFAGAAAAEVSFTGSGELGYNDTAAGDHDGFYWEADLEVIFSQELDNGVTATLAWDIDITDTDDGTDLVGGGVLLSLVSDMGGLYFGETAGAALTYWSAAGDMESDGFSEHDGEFLLRGEVMFGGVTAGLSYVVADQDGNTFASGDDLVQLSVGASGSFGNLNFAVAYQEEADFTGAAIDGDVNGNEIFGISVGTSFAGADVTLAYADNSTAGTDSLGIQVGYPVGPVTVTAYYVMEDGDDNFGVTLAYSNGPVAVTLDYDDDQGVQKINLDGSYDLGNGLTILAGASSEDGVEDEFYVAGSFDLGGGATLLASFADGRDDEVGSPEYQDGATVEVSFEF